MWLYDLVSYQGYPQECMYLCASVYMWVCMYVYVWCACVYVWGIVCLPKEVGKCACVCICAMWGGVYVCGVYVQCSYLRVCMWCICAVWMVCIPNKIGRYNHLCVFVVYMSCV